MTSRILSLSCALLLLCICGSSYAAGRKSDVIILNNGDKITGELVSLFGGILEYKTDSMGTLKIEWKDVDRLESTYNYEIRLSSGRRYYGTLLNPEQPGDLRVKDIYGEHELASLEVVEIRQIADKLLDRIDLYLAVTYSYSKASSVAQIGFNTDISYEDEISRNSFTGRTTVTTTDEADTSSTKLNLSRQTWTDRAKRYRVLFGNFEANDELGLDSRVAAGLGWGRYFVDTNRMRFDASAGLQVLTEQTSEGEADQSTEIFIHGEFAAWKFDSPELDVDFSATLYPSLTKSGRVRGDTDLRFRWEIVEDLYWDITAYGTYDNDTEENAETDYGVTTGLGWQY